MQDGRSNESCTSSVTWALALWCLATISDRTAISRCFTSPVNILPSLYSWCLCLKMENGSTQLKYFHNDELCLMKHKSVVIPSLCAQARHHLQGRSSGIWLGHPPSSQQKSSHSQTSYVLLKKSMVINQNIKQIMEMEIFFFSNTQESYVSLY